MNKFRTLKSNLIGCRRDSQRVQQTEICKLKISQIETNQSIINSIPHSLVRNMGKELREISSSDYKIART